MATDNDVYELIHSSTQFGVLNENIYFYQRGTAITADAQALTEEWIEQVLPAIQAMRGTDFITEGVTTRNLFDPTDNFSGLLNAGGTVSPFQQLPTHDAVNFTLQREDSTTRNGSKRLGGLGEPYQDDGVITDGGMLGILTDIADAMGETILGTLSAEWFFPVIVKRILTGEEYRLPESLAEATVNAILDVVFSPAISTQNSRKLGNGA